MPDTPWLTRRQVATYLQVTVRTLETWAQAGGGPPYYVLRPRLIRYRKTELDAWVEQGRRLHTADDGSATAILAKARGT